MIKQLHSVLISRFLDLNATLMSNKFSIWYFISRKCEKVVVLLPQEWKPLHWMFQSVCQTICARHFCFSLPLLFHHHFLSHATYHAYECVLILQPFKSSHVWSLHSAITVDFICICKDRKTYVNELRSDKYGGCVSDAESFKSVKTEKNY